MVLVCVGNDDDVRAVVLGESGALAAMKPGAILVDHTTASADLARELAEAAQQQGKQFLDAPVSGGQAGAENGALTVMIGGDRPLMIWPNRSSTATRDSASCSDRRAMVNWQRWSIRSVSPAWCRGWLRLEFRDESRP